MPTVNLAFETPDYSGGPCCVGETKEERPMKEVYPSLTIPNNLALAKALTAGQEFTATVTFRVAEVMIRERADGEDVRKGWDYPGDGVRVELEAKQMVLQGVAVKEDSGEKDGATAIKNFFANKRVKMDNSGGGDGSVADD